MYKSLKNIFISSPAFTNTSHSFQQISDKDTAARGALMGTQNPPSTSQQDFIKKTPLSSRGAGDDRA